MSHRASDNIDHDEWRAQEQGLALYRQGLDGQPASQAEKSYVYLAENLTDQVPKGLPASFVSDTLHWVATGRPKPDAETRGFERLAVLALLVAFGGALAVLSIILGLSWLEALLPIRSLLAHVPGWVILLTGCLGISACLSRKAGRRRIE